ADREGGDAGADAFGGRAHGGTPPPALGPGPLADVGTRRRTADRGRPGRRRAAAVRHAPIPEERRDKSGVRHVVDLVPAPPCWHPAAAREFVDGDPGPPSVRAAGSAADPAAGTRAHPSTVPCLPAAQRRSGVRTEPAPSQGAG